MRLPSFTTPTPEPIADTIEQRAAKAALSMLDGDPERAANLTRIWPGRDDIDPPPLADRARLLLKAWPEPVVAERTAAEYQRAARRVVANQKAWAKTRTGGGEWPGIEAMTTNRRTFYNLRRGVQVAARRAVVNGIEKGDDKLTAVGLSLIRRYLPDGLNPKADRRPDQRPASALHQPTHGLQPLRRRGEPPPTIRPARPSKRDLAHTLPADWLSDLWSQAQRTGNGKPYKHLNALAALICTGCRPRELANGVKVKLAAPDVLEFEIIGAKVTKGHGQPVRWLGVDPATHPAAAHLARLAADKTITVTGPAPAAISVAVTDLLGDSYGRRLSPYDVRHARAADARTVFAADLAMASVWQGHTAKETLQHYARSKGGRMHGPRPVSARGTRPTH